MKEIQPTWPQTFLLAGLGASFLLCCYLLSRYGAVWGAVSWFMLVFLALVGLAFLGAVYFIYLRPRYGQLAFPFFLVFLTAHLLLAAVIWRMGVGG